MRSSQPSLERARFAPGDVLDGRYRIVALLGRGGMGEVYRAEDLKLGQAVALKFLPEELEQNPERLRRFLDEARVARQVAHPNVCRVYDVSEIRDSRHGIGGRHFIAMEYVDGEDLASLLRRIGRLPEDKAVQLAREICAGVAAAHREGVLHRDLKPANVMIDGKGRARITDFGLAGLAGSFAGVEILAGTPAYMAPEQLDGREVSRRSDVYSLGLVLYELFTGKPAYAGGSAEELRRARSESAPPDLTSVVPGLDPAIERTVLRCLETDPALRPESALAVSAALPGGDPLAAALAAGETPSPEMVAAAGVVGGLRPGTAFALMALVLFGVAGIVLTHSRQYLPSRVDLPLPPEALVFKSRQILEQLGYDLPGVDRAHGFVYDSERLSLLQSTSEAANRSGYLFAHPLEPLPGPIAFWYRESPRYMVPLDFNNVAVTRADPALDVPGMVLLRLDPAGRLQRFVAVPSPARQGRDAVATDWGAILEHTGLDATTVRPAESAWNPPVFCNEQRAFLAGYPGQKAVVRVETCALEGRAVYFEVVPQWRRARAEPHEPPQRTIDVVSLTFLFVMLAGCVALARLNLRYGRGDRRGALRLAIFVFVVNSLIAVFGAHHVPTFAESRMFFRTLGWGLIVAGMVWLAYLALEPYARRLWPDVLVSWSRLLAGRFRDPLVGRDVLIGGCFGVTWILTFRLSWLLPDKLGLTPPPPAWGPVGGFENGALVALEGAGRAAAAAAHVPLLTLTNTLAGIVLLVLTRVVLRRRGLAVAATYLLLTAVATALITNPALDLPLVLILNALYLVVLIRFGLLASSAHMLVTAVDQFLVVGPGLTAWHAGPSWFLLAAMVGVFGFALRTALGARPSPRFG